MEYIHDQKQLSAKQQSALTEFVTGFSEATLLDRQSEYDGLFERGRSLSLHFFEHLHGESRDRGQAMVDLIHQYRSAGLEVGVRELPDYIPLYLEFASTQQKLAVDWLDDIAPVLAVLAVRLEHRKSSYAQVVHSLLQLCSMKVDLQTLREQVSKESRDDTPKALDKVWEEEAVTFGGDATNGGCASSMTRPTEKQRRDQNVPINFHDAAAAIQSNSAVRY